MRFIVHENSPDGPEGGPFETTDRDAAIRERDERAMALLSDAMDEAEEAGDPAAASIQRDPDGDEPTLLLVSGSDGSFAGAVWVEEQA